MYYGVRPPVFSRKKREKMGDVGSAKMAYNSVHGIAR